MQDAIALTWETLAARVRNYRFGAFASLGLAVFLLVLIVFIPSWWLLAGIPAFLLLGYVFAALWNWLHRARAAAPASA